MPANIVNQPKCSAAFSGDLDTILWEAARSGWREGYSAETGDSGVPGYSRYILPYSADLNGKLEAIARARVSLKLGRMFDWELQFEDSVSPEEADRMLDECKAAGKPAQYAGFSSGKIPSGDDWLAVARRQSVIFSFSGMCQLPFGFTPRNGYLSRSSRRSGPCPTGRSGFRGERSGLRWGCRWSAPSG